MRGEVEELVRGEVRQEIDALRAELDLKSEETALLKKEVKLLQEQEEVVSWVVRGGSKFSVLSCPLSWVII